MTLRDKLFSFDGRLRRRDWWFGSLATAIAYVVVVVVATLVAGGPAPDGAFLLAARFGDPIQHLLLTAAVNAPFVYIQTALAAKRAHDRNQGARLVILLVLATTVLGYLPDHAFATLGRMIDQGAVWALPLMVAGVVNIVAPLYLLVVLGFIDGSPGPNRFGPSPKGLPGGAPAFMAPGGLG